MCRDKWTCCRSFPPLASGLGLNPAHQTPGIEVSVLLWELVQCLEGSVHNLKCPLCSRWVPVSVCVLAIIESGVQLPPEHIHSYPKLQRGDIVEPQCRDKEHVPWFQLAFELLYLVTKRRGTLSIIACAPTEGYSISMSQSCDLADILVLI